MIDICPVGALTSKPFRYSARTWELSRRKSVSPHDSTGANLIVQVKNNKVMRVVPLENEASTSAGSPTATASPTKRSTAMSA
jgi:NADH-quinone oxidoreductase subunit G